MSDRIPETYDDAAHEIADELYEERNRQIFDEGFSPERDVTEHQNGQLAMAAAAYLVSGTAAERQKGVFASSFGPDAFFVPECWPMGWDPNWFKPGDRRRNLVKAGALIIAELERLDRTKELAEAFANALGQILPHMDDEGGGQ